MEKKTNFQSLDSFAERSLVSLALNPSTSTSLTTLTRAKKRQCGLLLKENVSIWNFFSLLLIIYLMVLGFLMAANFFTVLMQDTKYYVIS